MIDKLDYVPSWLDGATTILDKLDLCIKRIEEISPTSQTEIDKKLSKNLSRVLIGGDGIVVDESEETNKVEVHIDNEVNNNLARALKTPLSAPQNLSFVMIDESNSQIIVGENDVLPKLYLHNFAVNWDSTNHGNAKFSLYSQSPNELTPMDIHRNIRSKVGTGKNILVASGFMYDKQEDKNVYAYLEDTEDELLLVCGDLRLNATNLVFSQYDDEVIEL